MVVAGLAWQADGGVDSAAFAFLNVFVTAYAAMFFSRRALTAHVLWSLTASGIALSATDLGNKENGYFVVVLALTMSTLAVLLSRLMRQVWTAATHDTVTSLLNEAGLRAAISGASGDGLLLVCDINRFAKINDALGRDAGDDLLRAVSQSLTHLWSDAALARISADVFAVWLDTPDTDLDGYERVIKRVQSVQGSYPVGGITVDVTVTVGAASADGRSPTTSLRRAATALAAAKHDARPWYSWNAGMDRERSDDLQLQAELRAALANRELLLHYQPQVARGDHHISGVEALIRWQHPSRGLLGPSAFLPAAEHSPLIGDITDYVLTAACSQGAAWDATGAPLPVSVNLSARSLTDDALPARVAAHLAATGLPAHLLTVEITETALIAQPEQAERLLQAIRVLGVRVSIDDFGTGHTSLALLTDLAIDEIKLDRRFVAAAATQPSAAAVVVTIADLARRLGLHTVAEGVEDQTTTDLLDRYGYDLQQGFWHARPQPAAAITAQLHLRRKAAGQEANLH